MSIFAVVYKQIMPRHKYQANSDHPYKNRSISMPKQNRVIFGPSTKAMPISIIYTKTKLIDPHNRKKVLSVRTQKQVNSDHTKTKKILDPYTKTKSLTACTQKTSSTSTTGTKKNQFRCCTQKPSQLRSAH